MTSGVVNGIWSGVSVWVVVSVVLISIKEWERLIRVPGLSTAHFLMEMVAV
jgi:hypothetical protein